MGFANLAKTFVRFVVKNQVYKSACVRTSPLNYFNTPALTENKSEESSAEKC